jgi:putative cardiolipin synthase
LAAAYQQRLQTVAELTDLLGEQRIFLAVDKVRIIADPPAKSLGRRRAPGVLGAVRGAMGSAHKRVLLGTRFLIALVRRGVAVSILTNSLAATDVLAVHGGYARHCRRLLRVGVKLHELKRGGQEGRSLFGSGGAGLHTKAFASLDPRSANLNTEMGTFVQDTRLARKLHAEYDRLTDPSRSWTVNLEDGRSLGGAMLAARHSCSMMSRTPR